MTKKEVKLLGKTLNLTMRNDGDWSVAHELFLDKQYRQCDEAIKNAKGGVIDIGGHLGFFSLYAATINPTVPIYTFEPHEGNFALLKENLKQNHIKNVQPKMVAVSDKIAELELQISQEDLNHSLVKAIEPTGLMQKVQTTTLERIFEKNKITHCDLVKIDCEGSEFAILYSTPKSIFDKIQSLFIEYHDWAGAGSHHDLKTHLQKQGYKVTDYPNHKFKELGFLWCRH